MVAGDLTSRGHRDRTQQTAYLVQQDEGRHRAELVTYTLRIRNRNGVLVRTPKRDCSAPPLSGRQQWPRWMPVRWATASRSKSGAERDGLSSWQPQVRVMDRAGYGLRWGQYWGGV